MQVQREVGTWRMTAFIPTVLLMLEGMSDSGRTEALALLGRLSLDSEGGARMVSVQG